MAEPSTTVKPEELLPGRILQGEHAYEAAIDLVIASAGQELLIFDTDLSQGGYSSVKRYEALRSFLAKGRANRLTIILHETDYLTSRCPRLMGLVKAYGHAISIRKTDEQVHGVNDALVIADQLHYLHRLHRDHARFRYELDAAANTKPLFDRFLELQEFSHPAVSVTTLGL